MLIPLMPERVGDWCDHVDLELLDNSTRLMWASEDDSCSQKLPFNLWIIMKAEGTANDPDALGVAEQCIQDKKISLLELITPEVWRGYFRHKRYPDCHCCCVAERLAVVSKHIVYPLFGFEQSLELMHISSPFSPPYTAAYTDRIAKQHSSVTEAVGKVIRGRVDCHQVLVDSDVMWTISMGLRGGVVTPTSP